MDWAATKTSISEWRSGKVPVRIDHQNERPAHYVVGGIETIDYIQSKLTKDQFTGFCLGNCIKYLSRYQYKDGRKDLEKALVYLRWLLEADSEDK
jgi:hypothetical protein